MGDGVHKVATAAQYIGAAAQKTRSVASPYVDTAASSAQMDDSDFNKNVRFTPSSFVPGLKSGRLIGKSDSEALEHPSSSIIGGKDGKDRKAVSDLPQQLSIVATKSKSRPQTPSQPKFRTASSSQRCESSFRASASGERTAKPSQQGHEHPDIYFSPVEDSRGAWLSSPLPSPGFSQLSGPDNRRGNIGIWDLPTPPDSLATEEEESNEGEALTSTQVDRLVRTLVASPLLQRRAKARRHDESPKNAEASTEHVSDSPIVSLQLTAPDGRRITAGSFSSQRIGTVALAARSCASLDVPLVASVGTTLRIEQPPLRTGQAAGGVRVMLHIVNQVIERKTKVPSHLLAIEIDVTEKFLTAAMRELSVMTDFKSEQVELSTLSLDDTFDPSKTFTSTNVDWCALADDYDRKSLEINIAGTPATHMPCPTTPTYLDSTVNLLSSLEDLERQHQYFLILRPTSWHANNMPASLSIPWASTYLHDLFTEDAEAAFCAKDFREQLVDTCTRRFPLGRAFEETVAFEGGEVGRNELRVRCSPLGEGAEGKVGAWVVFVEI